MNKRATRMVSLTRMRRYGIAVVSVAVIAILRLGLSAGAQSLPSLVFIFPIILASWCGGLGPGLLATGLSLAFGGYPPTGSLSQFLMHAATLASAGVAVSILFDRTRKTINVQQYAQDMIDAMPSGVFIYDLRQKKSVFINRVIVAVLGYAPGPDTQQAGSLRSLVHPDDWQPFVDHLERCGDLADDATAEFEFRLRHSNGAWRWFHIRDRVFRRDKDGVREIIGAAMDITERKNAENEARFMSELNQALTPLADPKEIMATTVHMLGEHLGVDRCGYAEVDMDQDHFVILGNYTRGEAMSITGRYRMSDFGEREQKVLRGNRPYVVNDIEAESPPELDISLYRRGQIRAMICVPLNKDGHFVARMAVNQSTPRYWTAQEINLVNIVANRCWESVERATALRRLKESDDRYRAFIANSSEGIFRYELETSISVDLPEDEQIDMLYKYAYLAECNDAMARMYGFESADEIVGARIGDLLVKSNPQNIAFLRALRREGYRLTDVETQELDRFGNLRNISNSLSAINENGVLVRAWGTQRDITAQKRAEEALRASEERYRLLTELSPDGVVVAGADGMIHLANQSMLRMLGAPPEHVTGHNLFEFIAPEFQDHCAACMKALMSNGSTATQVEAVFRSEDGRSIPVEVSAVRADGNQRFAQLVVHDLRGRKQAEAEREHWSQEIENERDRLKRILEQMPIGVLIAEAPSGKTMFHNIEAGRLLRHPFLFVDNYREYVKYGALKDDGTPYKAEEYPSARSLLSGEVVKSEEMKYQRGDSTETFLSVDSAPIYDPEGRMVLTVATFIDIGERKRAEAALRESEERFAKAFQASPDALVISRIADGVVLEVNDSFVSMSGYSRQEIIGKSPQQLGLYGDPSTRRRALEILQKEDFVRDFELTMRRRSGELRLVLFSAEPLELRGEHCWLTLGRDITESKRVEEERERLLLQEKAAREEAEAASRMKDEFLATISHELRTPLTSILGWASMLSAGSLSEFQTRRALKVIEQSARSQAGLVDDILDTSRIITGRLKLDAQPVDIEKVFQAAVDVIRPSAEAKRISLQVLIDERGAIVLGDANRLQQVIWNLLSNAVKFTNEGGRVEARLSQVGGHAEISITDTGMGIEPQFMPYVFDRFRQADSTSTRKYGGLGLGLAIVRHVVEMHGGAVAASSAGKDMGSTFTVRFPIASPEVLQHHEKRPPVPGKQSTDRGRLDDDQNLDGVRVLVVEDDPDTLDMLKVILQRHGAEVTTAPSADDALKVIERWRPDALVSDLAMPDQDGYELIGQLRLRGADQGGNIPAVALTAYARVEDRVRALSAGYQMHVPKPVDPDELVAVVANLTRLPH